MLHISLFSGLGGFEVAAQWMGWKNIVSCEINEFANTVRGFYWPESYHHKDIHTLSYETIDTELSKRFGSGWRNDDIVLTGGFPCQPFSTAGSRKGTDDSRYLWPEMLRVIREVRPKWIVGENVYGLVNWDGGVVLDKVCSDLENEGFKVLPVVLPAAGVNAPHKRDRIFFIAHARPCGDSGAPGQVQGETEEKNRGGSQSGAAPGQQVQLFDESGSLFGDAPQDPVSHGRILGEPVQEGAGVREQRDACTRDTERVRGEEMAGVAADSEQSGLQGQHREREGCSKHRGDEGVFFGSEDKLNAADTRLQRQEKRQEQSMGVEQLRKEWNAPDPNGNGLEGCIPTNIDRQVPGEEEHDAERISTRPRGVRFEDFPTQSPICGRDDELSSRLHGITFSKWRTESIKGYGNAVVPALVYQLFATIQRMEDDPQLKLF